MHRSTPGVIPTNTALSFKDPYMQLVRIGKIMDVRSLLQPVAAIGKDRALKAPVGPDACMKVNFLVYIFKEKKLKINFKLHAETRLHIIKNDFKFIIIVFYNYIFFNK
ncbi:MAG: hypothetical protein RBR15_10000 [Sphaerochaeta sp.]|nr:hypothetical protein [Sphaerochaeta sp.]